MATPELKKDTSVEHLEYGDVEDKGDLPHHRVADQAAADYIDTSVVITPEEDKAMRMRIHKRILPLMCLAYFLQALDKGTLGTSSIMGWQESVGAKGQDYALTSTCLWIGIIVGEPIVSPLYSLGDRVDVQANQCVRKLPLAKLLSAGTFVWSALLMGIAFSLNVKAVFALRFLLGLFESLIGPVLLSITVQWYKKEEQPFVSALWQAMLGLNGVVNGLLGFGFYHVKHTHGLAGWQWMTMAIALFSFCCSVTLYLLLPDTPTQARFLTTEEKVRFVERVRSNNQGIKQKIFRKEQAIEAARDPYTYLLFFLAFWQTLVVGGVGTFTLLLFNKAFGFGVLQSQLLNIPLGVMTVLMYFAMAGLIQKTRNTLYCMVAFAVPPIVGSVVLLCVAPNQHTRGGLIVAFYCLQVFQACNPAIFLMLSRNSAGQTKKSITYAVTYIGWAGGNAIAPQIFQSKWAPRYLHSLEIHLALCEWEPANEGGGEGGRGGEGAGGWDCTQGDWVEEKGHLRNKDT